MYVENWDPAESVARGVALLDETVPGWRDRIDLDTLDVESTSACVLGQVFAADAEHDGWYGGWGVGMRDLFGETDEVHSVPHGFEAPTDNDETSSRTNNYARLNEAWFVALDPLSPEDRAEADAHRYL